MNETDNISWGWIETAIVGSWRALFGAAAVFSHIYIVLTRLPTMCVLEMRDVAIAGNP